MIAGTLDPSSAGHGPFPLLFGNPTLAPPALTLARQRPAIKVLMRLLHYMTGTRRSG
jgi:hypothetical protein